MPLPWRTASANRSPEREGGSAFWSSSTRPHSHALPGTSIRPSAHGQKPRSVKGRTWPWPSAHTTARIGVEGARLLDDGARLTTTTANDFITLSITMAHKNVVLIFVGLLAQVARGAKLCSELGIKTCQECREKWNELPGDVGGEASCTSVFGFLECDIERGASVHPSTINRWLYSETTALVLFAAGARG